MLLALGGGLHLDAVGPLRAFFFELIYMTTASDELGFRYSGARALHSSNGFFQLYPSGVLWTLTVELTFYAVIPLFLFARARKGLAAGLIAVLCIVSILTNSLSDKSLLFSLSVIPYFWMFGIGMLFRLSFRGLYRWQIAIPSLLSITLLCGFVRGFEFPEWKIHPTAVMMIQTACLCLAALWIGISPILRSSWLARNDMSYGIYLYHMLIVAALLSVTQAERPQWLLLLVIAGAASMGILSWHLVERPAMNFVRRNRSPDERIEPQNKAAPSWVTDER